MTEPQQKIKINLISAISEIIQLSKNNLALNDIKLKITPVDEFGKTQTSVDDTMNLWFRKEYDYGKILKINEAVSCITAPHDKFPLWVKIKEIDKMTFELFTSKRYRSYKQLQNQETKYPPFQVIKII